MIKIQTSDKALVGIIGIGGIAGIIYLMSRGNQLKLDKVSQLIENTTTFETQQLDITTKTEIETIVNEKIVNAQNLLSDLESKLANQINQKNLQNAEITRLQSEIGQFQTQIESFNGILSAYSSKIASANSDLNSKESTLATTNSTLLDLEGQLSYGKSQLALVSNAWDLIVPFGQYYDWKNKVALLESQKASLLIDKSVQENAVANQRIEVDRLQTAYNSIYGQISTLQTEINARQTTINSITLILATIDPIIADLQSQINSVRST